MTNEFKTRRRQAASVDITPNRPHSASVTTQAAFLARHQSDQAQDITEVTQDGVTGVAVHNRPGTVVLYKPTERAGWQARTVSVAAMPMLFANGWSEFCRDCGGHHLDRQGRPTTDPNACSARESVAVRRCPVCGKRIYDNQQITPELMADDDDPNVISDDAYTSSTPAERTRLKLDLHLWVRHAEWAQANAVAPLPAAFKDMVETPTQRGT